MLAAGQLVGTRRCIAQSFYQWPFARTGGPTKTEETPLGPNPPASFGKSLAAIRYLEDNVPKATGLHPSRRRGLWKGLVSILRDG
jgi:hypothetical protein